MGKFGRLAGLCIVLLAALALDGCMIERELIRKGGAA